MSDQGGVAGRTGDRNDFFDFFISYTKEDDNWAQWIAWQLEAKGYRVLVQAWDFVPGSHWTARMEEGMTRSERTLAVLSSAYLKSNYGTAEWQAAFRADPHGFERKLIPVRVEDCARPGILGGVVSIDLFDKEAERAQSWLLDRVGAAMSGRAKPRIEPSFPGRDRFRPEPRFPIAGSTARHRNALFTSNRETGSDSDDGVARSHPTSTRSPGAGVTATGAELGETGSADSAAPTTDGYSLPRQPGSFGRGVTQGREWNYPTRRNRVTSGDLQNLASVLRKATILVGGIGAELRRSLPVGAVIHSFVFCATSATLVAYLDGPQIVFIGPFMFFACIIFPLIANVIDPPNSYPSRTNLLVCALDATWIAGIIAALVSVLLAFK